jgi:hypothetical protein
VPQCKFVFWPHVKNGYSAGARSFQKFFAGYRLEAIAPIKITAHYALDLGNILLGYPAYRCECVQDRIIGQPVMHEFAVAPGGDKSGARHSLQMLRCVGDRQPDFFGKVFYAAFALGELFQQFEAMRMSERLRDESELRKQCLFWAFA